MSGLEGGDRLIARNRREVVQEFVDTVSALEIVDQVAQRDSCTNENRDSAQDLRVAVHERAPKQRFLSDLAHGWSVVRSRTWLWVSMTSFSVINIAIATGIQDGTRIGIDVERGERRVNADGLARKFLTERERAEIALVASDVRRQRFLRLWTCKEAMSKATGDALSAPFRHMDVTLDGGPRLIAGPAPYAPAAWQLVSAATPPDLIATLAIWHQP